MEKYYDSRKLEQFNKEIFIMKVNCRFHNKSMLFNSINDLDFKNHYKMSMNYLNNIVYSCSERCGEHKCMAYKNFMQDVAKKYREEVNAK